MVNTVEKFEELLELQFQEYDIQNADGNLLQEPPENASRTSVPEASRTKCSEKVPLLPASCSYAKATQDDPIKLPNFSAQNDVLNTNKFNVEDKETSTSSSSTKKGNKIRFRKSPKNTTLLRYSF